MTYHLTAWPLLLRDNPDEARRRIREALTTTGGNVEAAARELIVSSHLLWRYIRALEMRAEIERIRALAP